MQRVLVGHLKPGMIIGRNIYDAEGRILLSASIELKQSYIDRLREIGIGSVYVEVPGLPAVEIPEVVREETRLKAVQAVKASFQNFRTTKVLNIKQFSAIAANIVEEIIRNRNTLLHLTDIRTYDDYTFAHCVNVCVLSVMIGLSLNYTEHKLRELALGALMHDVGKTLVPVEILNKPGRLNTAEMDVMKKHAELGFEVLRKQQDDIPLLAAHVAFQHQEKFDGSGYPRKLSGKDIHEYARIAAIADVYDALTSDRPYRKAMLPHEAFEIMQASGGTHFDHHLLQIFFRQIAVYPVGTIVHLNTGQIGMVTEVLPDFQTRPKVQVIFNSDGHLIKDLVEVNLAHPDQLTTFIEKVFIDFEVQEWLSARGRKTAAG